MAPVWNYENAAHLLRRVGFGGAPKNIRQFLESHTSVNSAVDELLSFKPTKRRPPGSRKIDDDRLRKMQVWWIRQMVKTRKPPKACHEKIVLFLHDHLACGLSKQETTKVMAFQNRLFRVNARGNFKTLIREFNRDPANLFFLDGILNVASDDGVHVNANENWGRELVELFTLGVLQLGDDGTPDPSKPNYTESDVHNLARASTGWTSIRRNLGEWNIEDWDGGEYDDDGDDLPDPMTIFGQTSNNFRIDEGVAGTSDDILELIFSRQDDDGNNQVGMFLSWKLWSWYAYPSPAVGLKSLLAGFASVFESSGFELEPLFRAMWTHDEFFSLAAKSRTVKNPVDFMVQAIKALGIRGVGKEVPGTDRSFGDEATGMGMQLFEPPNVAGWPSGLAWVTTGTLFERMEFARDLAGAESGPGRAKLRDIEDLPLGNAAADPGDVVDAILHQFGLDVGPLAFTLLQRVALIEFVTDDGLKPTLDLSTDRTDDAREKVRGAIALLLQSASAQLY